MLESSVTFRGDWLAASLCWRSGGKTAGSLASFGRRGALNKTERIVGGSPAANAGQVVGKTPCTIVRERNGITRLRHAGMELKVDRGARFKEGRRADGAVRHRR